MLEQRSPGFTTIKQLMNRLSLGKSDSRRVSVDDEDVPNWQRQLVWNEDEMGLLALSIIRGFPIGLLILWNKNNAVRVPIDGRQRLTAIREFAAGNIAIPDLPMVPDQYKKTKYKLKPGDEDAGFQVLDVDAKDAFEGYELRAIQYDLIPEPTAMEIFVMLQGGKSLTKTEIRAALGGKLADYVGTLTQHTDSTRHAFFRDLSGNLKNRRKSHRNVCDVLLHEFLYPEQDKHWTSLEKMYREKSQLFPAAVRKGFETELTKFLRAVTIDVKGVKRLMPQLRSPFFIVDVYRAWKELTTIYDLPAGFSFSGAVSSFETERASNPDDPPWIVYTNELSNAGYAKNRLDSRNRILMTYILQRCDGAVPKQRSRRTFTDAQKIAIWDRAEGQCEWRTNGRRCSEVFVNFRDADADHIVKWTKNGPTSVANGRLLCKKHNRGRK